MTERKTNRRGLLRNLSFNAASLSILVLFVLPVYYIFAGAFMSRAEVLGGAWLPQSVSLDNIRIALFDYNMIYFLRNSVIFTAIIVLMNLFFCALAGYALAKFDFPGRRILFLFILVAMLVPPLVMIVPLYLEVRQFRWIDTPLALIIPAFLSPFGVFLMRQYISQIPDSYIDAARTAGYNEFEIFLKIILPLSKPAIAALALYRFLFVWNDFFWPLVVLGGETWRTLPVAIQMFDAQYFEAYELKLATSLVGIIPIVILLIFASRILLRAMSRVGGIKI
ncbi:carbohydrate ABC transporter permease [Candidatus Bathyarchaeota archaeon]|nr:carbohydrate ABC transporter permease [Candidatus Bathyarchaeota archaeon]